MPISCIKSGTIWLRRSLLVWATFCLYLSLVAPAHGQDVNALFKQLNKEQRQAQKDLFAGKNDKAIALLEKLRDLLAQIKEADPNNPKLKTATRKYTKLVKDLERKTGQDLGGGSVTVAKSKVVKLPPEPEAKPLSTKKPKAPAPVKETKMKTAASPKPLGLVSASKAEKLPSGVTSRIKRMHQEMDKAEKSLEKGAGTGVDRAKRAERDLKRARGYKEEIEKRYSGKYSEDHPNVAEAFDRLARLEKRVISTGESAAADEDARRRAQKAKEASAAKAAADREGAKKAKAEAAAVSRKQAEQDCTNWRQRMNVYTDGDKALYRCVSAKDDDMPACKTNYDEAAALLEEFKKAPLAAEPCGSLRTVLSDLSRYMENFMASYERYDKKQAAAKANLGEIVFSKLPIDPNNPSELTQNFQAGDYIYGLIKTTKPFSAIYKNQNTASVMVNVKLDDKKIHAQFVKLKKPELVQRKHMVFEIAPDPGKMTAYRNADIEYGKSSATMRQGPNELTYHLGRLGPGKHTMAFEIQYYGMIWAEGKFTVEGKNFDRYAKLHSKIADEVAQSVTLPLAKMVNKKMNTEMKALLENAGWSNIHRINIVDKDWWIDRVSGGNSPVKSRHIAAAALAKGIDGEYFYKVCTFHQDKLITGGFGKLYLSHQGDKVPIPRKNIDK